MLISSQYLNILILKISPALDAFIFIRKIKLINRDLLWQGSRWIGILFVYYLGQNPHHESISLHNTERD